MSTSEGIYTRVKSLLVNVLAIDENEIRPSATVQGDLGAESIDVLDILFHLESEFDIDIPSDDLLLASVFKGNPEFVREGRVTDQGMSELGSRMPYADLAIFEKDRRMSAACDLFTVGMLTRYVEWKLDRNEGLKVGGLCVKRG